MRRRKLNVRYDKRTTNYIYFIKEEVINRAYLNIDKSVNQIYSDLTWNEVDEYKKDKKRLDDSKRHFELERAINFNLDVQKIVEKAKNERPIYARNKTTKVRQSRKNEKYQLDKERAIRIDVEHTEEVVNPQNITLTDSIREELTSTVDLLNFYKKKRVEEYYNE